MDLRNHTALVTGASSGIGASMATALAARGADVVLVARRADRLAALAERLERNFGVRAHPVSLDLITHGAAGVLAEEMTQRGLTIDVLVNNAGFGTHGLFVTEEAQRISEEIALNVTALVELTHAFLPRMVERDFGVVINVASTAAFQPLPHMAVYGATKAFVLSFTEALWGELQGTGVNAITLCPGATDTEFFDVGPGDQANLGARQSPDEVVALVLAALDRKSPPPSVIAGFRNAALAKAPRVVTRRTTIRLAGRMMAG